MMGHSGHEEEYWCTRSQTAQEENDFNLVSMLGLTPFKDGSQWCFLWGVTIQEGVCGFGKTVRMAALDFSSNVHIEEIKTNL